MCLNKKPFTGAQGSQNLTAAGLEFRKAIKYAYKLYCTLFTIHYVVSISRLSVPRLHQHYSHATVERQRNVIRALKQSFRALLSCSNAMNLWTRDRPSR